MPAPSSPPALTTAEPAPTGGVTEPSTALVHAGKGGAPTPSGSKRRHSKGPCSRTAKEREALEAEAAALKAAQKEAAVCEKELIVSGAFFGLAFQVGDECP